MLLPLRTGFTQAGIVDGLRRLADRYGKPVIAYIGGKAAREGTRFSHAGAIIEGGRGTHAGKVKALREAGATVVDAFGELPGAVVDVLKRMKGQSLMSDADKNAVTG